MNSKTILTVGLTHSWKTTFAHLLEESFENSFVLEPDKIAAFLKQDFSKLYHCKANSSTDLDNPNLKLSTFLKILEWGVNAWYSPILSNWNNIKQFRNYLINILHWYWFEVWIVFFNFPLEFIRKRIRESDRSTNIFRVSKSFEEVLDKQLSFFEVPVSDEADKFFEIKNEADFDDVLNEVKNWILEK